MLISNSFKQDPHFSTFFSLKIYSLRNLHLKSPHLKNAFAPKSLLQLFLAQAVGVQTLGKDDGSPQNPPDLVGHFGPS